MMQMQQHLIIQQQQFLRELIERINPVGAEAPQVAVEEPPIVIQEEQIVELSRYDWKAYSEPRR